MVVIEAPALVDASLVVKVSVSSVVESSATVVVLVLVRSFVVVIALVEAGASLKAEVSVGVGVAWGLDKAFVVSVVGASVLVVESATVDVSVVVDHSAEDGVSILGEAFV